MAERAILLIISGPAGSGKTTLCHRLLEEYAPSVQRVVTSTTRDPRPGEIHKRDYYFFSIPEFEKLESQGAFYETANVHGRRYGTLKREVHGKLGQNIDCLLNIDVQGAVAFFNSAKSDPLLAGRVHSVFIMPPDLDTIKQRILARGETDLNEINRRLESAEMEIGYADQYDTILNTSSREADWTFIKDTYLSRKRS
ncbi:MAG: guanylate kinase [Verrucomicrobiota bacterium]